jgi:NAD(P)-dependent dehydrogenase (short-subunit alcohol dehydrogenase family)
MPLDYLGAVFLQKTHTIPHWEQIKQLAPPLVAAFLFKLYTNGSSNTWERKLHGKVYIMTGGTSGIGASLAREMASRGAQLILLTSQAAEDADASAKIWLTDYIEDLRESTGNEMIYAEDCDLSSLYSIRKFATKWLDNKPARRLDGIICLAGESLPMGKLRSNSIDGIEIQMAINYLGHYQLLTLLVPALKVQPPDRDVRVLLSSCLSQNLGQIDLNDLLWEERSYPQRSPWKVYGTSKLLLNMFAKEFQRKLESVERADKQPCGVRVNIVNPGIVRSPSTRRFLSFGTVWGLLLYLVLYPIFWLMLKSTQMGMQSYIYALNSPEIFPLKGGQYIKECKIIEQESRKELHDPELQKKVFEITAAKIDKLERASALERNKNKSKKKDEKVEKKSAKSTGVDSSSTERAAEIERARISVFASAFSGAGAGAGASAADPLFPSGKPPAMTPAREKVLAGLEAKLAASK